ncbi:MAG: hypothetical protein U0790_11690 [Isosphaeraceae bacterium]
MRQDLSPVPALDADLIPGVLRDWLVDIAERISCPLEFPAAGGIVPGHRPGPQAGDPPQAVRRLDRRAEPWGVVGDAGGAQSPSLVEVLRPLRELEARAREDHEKALREHARAAHQPLPDGGGRADADKAVRNKVSEADLLDLARQLAGDGPRRRAAAAAHHVGLHGGGPGRAAGG